MLNAFYPTQSSQLCMIIMGAKKATSIRLNNSYPLSGWCPRSTGHFFLDVSCILQSKAWHHLPAGRMGGHKS